MTTSYNWHIQLLEEAKTLVTCKDYDEKTKTYKNRVVVRAALVKVDWDK